jgi:hypothetical protein
MATHELEIEALNAEAAAFLSSTAFMVASKRWCDLLRLLVPHLQVPSSAALEQADATLTSSTSASNLEMQFVDIPPLDTVEEEHVFAAFRYGIVYTSASSPASSSGCAWDAREYRKAAIATCYNMALSHHLHGLRSANHAESLERALRGYRLARGLLESLVPDVAAEPQDVMVLALAIANNEGHVLASRYDRAGANECWLDLQWLLQHASPTLETLHFFATVATYPGDDGVFSLHAPVA